MTRLKFSSLLVAGFLTAGFHKVGHATPVNAINVFVNASNFTAGITTNTVQTQIFINAYRPGVLPPDEVETISLAMVRNGVVLENAISPTTFNTAVGNTNYLFSTPIILYYAGSGLQLRATSPSGTVGISGSFTVQPSSATKLVVLAPGQTHVPGTNPTLTSGRTGTATIQQQSQAFPITVHLTDNQFNVVNQNDTVSFASGDLITLPSAGALSAGSGSFNVTMTSPKISRTITVTDATTASVLPGATSVEPAGPPSEEVFPFPSPFNPKIGGTITFRYRIETAASTKLKVTDMFGQAVWEKNVESGVGTTDIVWDGRNENGSLVTAGIYYAILEVGGNIKSRKKFGVTK
ncbi:MAG: hypothetical protein A2901_03110 [Elusimicrobia bacterium RIFCSPLOWO2_01_FULL_54_10]|nr:MAG: hypothetical protein A2901_03110 [Elusimicrobia bacterium RIFCSPLOWO2_01_FULL_54_10]